MSKHYQRHTNINKMNYVSSLCLNYPKISTSLIKILVGDHKKPWVSDNRHNTQRRVLIDKVGASQFCSKFFRIQRTCWFCHGFTHRNVIFFFYFQMTMLNCWAKETISESCCLVCSERRPHCYKIHLVSFQYTER